MVPQRVVIQAPASADEVIELRPSAQEYRTAVKGRAVFMVPFIAIMFLRVLGNGDTLLQKLLLAGGLLVLLSVLIALSIVHIRTSVVRLSPGRIEHHALLVRNRSLSTDGLQGILTSMRQPMNQPVLMLVLHSPESGATVRLSGGLWTPDVLESIAHHARVEVSDRELSGMDIQRRVPKSMPLRYRRPWSFAFIVTILIVAVVTASTIWWFDHNDLPPFDDQPPQAVSAATVAAQNGLSATIEEALPGSWEPERVTFHTCENDEDVKGWTRWVDGRRAGGRVAAVEEFDVLGNQLVELDFYPADVSSEENYTSLWTSTDGPYDESTSVRVSQSPTGDVFVELHGPCEVPDDLNADGE